MNSRSHIPLATYRLQLNRDFTFKQATEVVPYLSALGISHCYISPCLKARPGSMHGYDIVDHNAFNPEIGCAEDFDRFVAVLHEHGMGLILDFVPNHMGVMGSDNSWWLDVLENGESSSHASFFDIDWHPLKDELHGKVLLPVLHDHYGAVLESGELKLCFECTRGEFYISYRVHRFPIGPREYPRIARSCEAKLIVELGEQNPDLLEFQSLITAFSHLPGRGELDNGRIVERHRDKEIHKRRLSELCSRSPQINASILEAVNSINGDVANPASFEELHELIKAQAFRLANWRVASDDINYRRFFDTNDLAGIRIENENVFQKTHRLVLKLIAGGKVDGLRLDHPDGLYDPAEYFRRLNRGITDAIAASMQEANLEPGNESRYEPEFGPRCGPRYVVIEKVLTGSERLPEHWPVCGTTGYNFSNLANGLFADSSALMRMERIYRNFIKDQIDFNDLAYRCRKLIIRVALVSELNVLANQLSRIALSKRRTCDFTLNSLRDALTEVVANFPVYRSYVSASGVSESDERYIRVAIALAKGRSPAEDTSVFDFINEVLLNRIAEGQDLSYQNAVATFAMKFQQFTSPVMAKGLEDTAFYQYNRLVSLNDVGADLREFGVTTAEFHSANEERLCAWPHTMLTTSTHDSKRSEDVRARINVLSEMSGPWRLHVRDWARLNRKYKRMVNGKPAPSSNDEYLLYQTLVGAMPAELLPAQDIGENACEKSDKEWTTFASRIENYMLKAIREAKQNTSWINRNAEYETAMSSFVTALLTPGGTNRFLDDFMPFGHRIARLGQWNSLAQTLLKLTCPGVPDIYQGNELWDFSLVDPDNRRPVDYELRRQMFESVRKVGSNLDASSSMASLLVSPDDGRLKLYLTWRALCLRQQEPELFQRGEYIALSLEGPKADHAIAFLRKSESATALIVVPRLVANLLNEVDVNTPPIGAAVWEDTHIVIPSNIDHKKCRNLLTGEVLHLNAREDHTLVPVSATLGRFPVALCVLG